MYVILVRLIYSKTCYYQNIIKKSSYKSEINQLTSSHKEDGF